MVLFGTIVNGLGIIIGSICGLAFTSIKKSIKETVMQAIGLVVLVIGIQMALSTENIIIVLISMLLGAVIGELLQLEYKIQRFGAYISVKTGSHEGENGSFADGFVAASLLFAVGAMATIGALDSGIRLDHELLLTKAALDGFTALVLTSTLGIGVLFSFIPVIIYQGSIALLATQIEAIIPSAHLDGFMNEMTSVGGILIIAIALNILNITNIRIANILPAVVVVAGVYAVANILL